jgi:hypothetical protein
MKKHTKRDLGYGKRNEILKSMGFLSYGEYLKSELWQIIRNKVLQRNENKCQLCGKPAKVVHHAGYYEEQLRGDELSHLFSLCHFCHRKIEFDSTEYDRKLSAESVIKKTLDLIKNKGKSKGNPWLGLKHKHKWRRRHGR